MNSIVLKDLIAIDALIFYATYELRKDGSTNWNPHAGFTHKFIILPDGTLVIGPVVSHDSLYAIHHADTMAKEAVDAVSQELHALRDRDKHRSLVIGAGAIDRDGKIVDWKSGFFKLETPVSLRDGIEQEIVRLHAGGQLQ